MTSNDPRLHGYNSVMNNPKGQMAHLKDSANFEGRTGKKGRLMNATKKQAAAPSKQAPNPNNLM